MAGITEERKEIAIHRLTGLVCVIKTKEISEDIMIILHEIDVLKAEIKELKEVDHG